MAKREKKPRGNGPVRDVRWYAAKVAKSYPGVYQSIQRLSQELSKVSPTDAPIVSAFIGKATRPTLKAARAKLKEFRAAAKGKRIDERLSKNEEQRAKLEKLKSALPA